MKYRSRDEILAEILEIANGNTVRISKIIQYSNIPHNLLKEYLAELITNDLLEYREIERTYKTSPIGVHFISIHNQMNELMTTATTKMRSDTFVGNRSRLPLLKTR
jgi:predicted transcriptional regulator